MYIPPTSSTVTPPRLFPWAEAGEGTMETAARARRRSTAV